MQRNHYCRKWSVFHEFESFTFREIAAGFAAGFFVVLMLAGLYLAIPNDAPRGPHPTDQQFIAELGK